MQQGQQPAPYAGLPETVRVRALKGFRGLIDGQMGVANPEDVVDVPRDLAVTLRFGGKAVMVNPAEVEKKRQTNYLPERKKNKPVDPAAQQLAALVDAVGAMKDAIATQGKAIETLLAKQK